MLEECVDYLELATKSLNQKITMLEEEESSLIFETDENQSFHDDLYQATLRTEIGNGIPSHPPGSSALSTSSKATTFIQNKA